MDSLRTNRVLFLGEQDGLVEREFKGRLQNNLSAMSTVLAAFLTRVSYVETPGSNVALCIQGAVDDPEALALSLAEEFRKFFHSTEKLDIIFLSAVQVEEIRSVAKPFYEAS